MDEAQLKKDYDTYHEQYQLLQKEAFDFASGLRSAHELAIHVAHIHQRPGDNIKELGSIEKNNRNPEKYKACKSLVDIKDIAGVRVTCLCEDDVENFALLLEGELRQKYDNVDRQIKGGAQNTGKSRPPYRAVHITFSKKLPTGEHLHCEFQIRTVMADAWATLDRRYVYGKEVEGDAHDLTNAVSEIMNGCEKLWTMVKKKSSSAADATYNSIIENIRKEAMARLAMTRPIGNKELQPWFDMHSSRAKKGLSEAKYKTYMEVKIIPPDVGLNVRKSVLRDNARNSTIRTFGWPIGVFLEREEYLPKVDPDGIHAEISVTSPEAWHRSYDYWAINSNGGVYILKSLFEDERKPGEIFFNTRIVRITELLMYIRNLYKSFDVPEDAIFKVCVRHDGLNGKVLSSSSQNRYLSHGYKSGTGFVSTEIETSIREIDNSISTVVEKFTTPLFEIFNFFELSLSILEEIVTNFTKGKIV